MMWIPVLLFLSVLVFVNAQNDIIKYNVIMPAPSNQSVVVLVDDKAYPLKASEKSALVFCGEAPNSQNGYRYALVDSSRQNVISTVEAFTRSPLHNISSTPNQFFNRTHDINVLHRLPQILDPLPSIHRIKSDLHILEQIPTIHIHGSQEAVDLLHKDQLDDSSVKMDVSYISLNDIYNFEEVTVSVAGRSSRWVPKLSYKLKFKKKHTLFGYRHIKLRSFGHDPSYIRECIGYNVFNSVGIPTTGFSYVRLFMNKKPIGLFGLIETYQDPWTSNVFADGKEDYTSGHLYQGTGFSLQNITTPVAISDLRYEGDNLTAYSLGQYKVKAGPSRKTLDAYKDLQKFTKFINESTVRTMPEYEWEKKLDVDNFLRAMAIEDLLGLSDAYMTMADNYYLYQDPNQNNKFTYIPADIDTSLGICMFNISLMTSGNFIEHPGLPYRPLTKKLLSYKSYIERYEGMLNMFSKELVNPSVIFPFIDDVIRMIRPEVEWDQSLPRVGNRTLPNDPLFQDPAVFLDNMLPGFLATDQLIIFNETFDEAIEGFSTDNNTLSVKPFIQQKYDRITQLYNKPMIISSVLESSSYITPISKNFIYFSSLCVFYFLIP
ncbi:MAG: coth protein-domain-containing protein [Benjaminiella poitrasii]|nr:MAG: coth protein-domain-containing protein [Benjaminiella poitrasii]